MIKQIITSLFVCLVLSPVFAVECENSDEKFVKINSGQIGYSMYDTKIYANAQHKCTNKFDCDLYTDGDWASKNKDQANFYIQGTSACLDSDEYNQDTNTYGSYCFCNIKQLDGYKVLSDWVYVKHFQNNIFDEGKFTNSPQRATYEKQRIDTANLDDCMDKCSDVCQSSLSKLINSVNGFYTCGIPLYKKTNVNCVIGNKIVKAKQVLVFDESAEIVADKYNIVFAKDTSDKNNLFYIGKYGYTTVYLKIVNDKIYVGNQTYSMQECM